MRKYIAQILAVMLLAGILSGCSASENQTGSTGAASDVTMTVWGPSEDQVDENSFLQSACRAFAKNNPQWNISFRYGVCSEGDAGKNVTQDPTAAADVYMFANDQLGTLIQANAISKLGGSTAQQVKQNNSETIVKSVSDAEGNLYGVPFTGNTWFLYYNKATYSEEDIRSLDTMMEKGTVAFPITEPWYLPAFFYACGGTMFGDGTDAAAGIRFGGEVGKNAATYLADAIASGKLIDDASGSGLDGLRNGTVDAMFSGTWNAEAIRQALGENYGAAQLPTINIGGENRQLRAFAGSKAIGVNPHSKNPAVAVALAAFLGSPEMQKLHYSARNGGVIPCDITVLEDTAFRSDPATQAQDATIANTSVLQPSIPEMGQYWTNAESMGKALANREITHQNAQDAVEKWNAAINGEGSF